MAAALLPVLAPCRAAEPLHMVTAAQPPLGPSATGLGFLGNVAKQAFQRLGIAIDVAILPGERAMINVNAGIDDGELMRNPEIEKDYPALVRVPEPIYQIDIMGFSLTARPELRSFADLSPYRVGYVAGRKTIEDDVKAARQTTPVRTLEDLFELLQQQRVDIVIAERWQGIRQARKLGMPAVVLEPPLRTTAMYVFLNKRHADTAPRLADALKQMKTDGSYQRWLESTLGTPE